MWFKNCFIYYLSSEFEHSESSLEESLKNQSFKEIGRQETDAFGWVSPLGRGHESLVYCANGAFLLSMRKEQKVIPASMVKEALEDRVAQIEDAEGRKVYGKEKANLKDDILSLLKPKALTKSNHVYGYIDTRHELLVVNAGSASAADAFVELLIESLGSLGAVRLMGEESPGSIMNQWVLGGLPSNLELTGQFDLQDPKDDRVIKIKGEQDLELVKELLEDGFWVQKMGLRKPDEFSSVLTSDLLLKSLKFDDELLKENDDIDSQDKLARLDADFVLMTQTMAQFIKELMQHFKVNTDKE
ncbi:recombination-associated protein RdgC [Kangiella geojedonensis]|uniref:Recombination-associated protein RdgC n=1 Tax=Kangiella geojedonensis TaxID=914150 RepID=A0A0F6TPT2_9GAMM|nr:recombination-associated protein RdgC [Kangiella geojedonensis]AKE51649.1 Putative exonuclease RdgC [Kangiella geojedonensis]